MTADWNTAEITALIAAVGAALGGAIKAGGLLMQRRTEDRRAAAEQHTEEGKLLLQMQETASHWIETQARRNDELKQQFAELQALNNETVRLSNGAVDRANQANDRTRQTLADLDTKMHENSELRRALSEQQEVIKTRDAMLAALSRANVANEAGRVVAERIIETAALTGEPLPKVTADVTEGEAAHTP